MRSLRWLLLAAMVFLAAAVLGIFRSQRRALASHQRPLPPRMAEDTRTSALDWEWGQSAAGMPQVHITAKDMRQSADGSKAELRGIELRLYSKDGQSYVRVLSDEADFTTADNKLFAPGEAHITLDVPVSGEPTHTLTSITAAGLNFDSKAGTAVTEQPTSFTFEGGSGTSTGADYDPASHMLNLRRDVVLHLTGQGSAIATPMQVETGHLVWNETTAHLSLEPRAKLIRGGAVIESGPAEVQLKDSKLSWLSAPDGVGTDKEPGRNLAYSADTIRAEFDDNGKMTKLAASGRAKVTSTNDAATTTVTGKYVQLDFAPPAQGETSETLKDVLVVGNGNLESKPVAADPARAADTKIVRADSFDVLMRPGGKEIDRINTKAPGTAELIPNQNNRHRRVLRADSIAMLYGDRNEIREMHAIGQASTESYPSAEERARRTPVTQNTFTSSRTIDAAFDDAGQMKTLVHKTDFRFRQGTRQAQSDNAVLDNDTNRMNLDSHVRVQDEAGSTTADHMLIDQVSGDFDATGHVFTARQGESKPSGKDSGVLDSTQPLQGTADHVISTNHNRHFRYLGNAVLWQPANRIQADTVEIDRDTKALVAQGKVATQFEDQKTPTLVTRVTSRKLTYSDADLLATYSGGVDFSRPNLTVSSATLNAYLNPKDADSDSRINRAIADGKVEITELMEARTRIGTGEHAEYSVGDGKVVLSGGEPQLWDTLRGNTKGDLLTYFTDGNKLIVTGVPERQVKSHIRKKK